MNAHDDFEAPAVYPTDIEIKGKTRTYQICELADADVQNVFRTQDAKGNRDPRLMESFNSRVISKCVRREDGSPITVDEARAMRSPLTAALIRAVLDIHGIAHDVDKAIEAAEGN